MADWPPLKNAAFSFPVSFYTSAGVLVTNPTLAAGDCKLSTDFGALNPITILPDAEPDASAQVRVQCSAGEMNGNQIHIVFADQTSPKEWADFDVTIYTAARQIQDLAFPATSGRSLAIDASGRVDLGAWLGIAPLALSSQRVQAQTGGNGGTLTLAYTVTNASTSALVDGATVELYSDATRTTLVDSQVTNSVGVATFSNLVAGTYYLKIIKSGFATQTDTEVVS